MRKSTATTSAGLTIGSVMRERRHVRTVHLGGFADPAGIVCRPARVSRPMNGAVFQTSAAMIAAWEYLVSEPQDGFSVSLSTLLATPVLKMSSNIAETMWMAHGTDRRSDDATTAERPGHDQRHDDAETVSRTTQITVKMRC